MFFFFPLIYEISVKQTNRFNTICKQPLMESLYNTSFMQFLHLVAVKKGCLKGYCGRKQKEDKQTEKNDVEVRSVLNQARLRIIKEDIVQEALKDTAFTLRKFTISLSPRLDYANGNHYTTLNLLIFLFLLYTLI